MAAMAAAPCIPPPHKDRVETSASNIADVDSLLDSLLGGLAEMKTGLAERNKTNPSRIRRAEHRKQANDEADKQCRICMCEREDPIQLSCGHAFCSECARHWEASSPGDDAPCPVCRTPFSLPARDATDGGEWKPWQKTTNGVVMLEEILDPEYEPSEPEIIHYANWLGMRLPDEESLLWVCREALLAPLPPSWRPCRTATQEVFYFNVESGVSAWEHPSDEQYRRLYEREKERLEEQRRPKESAARGKGRRSGA